MDTKSKDSCNIEVIEDLVKNPDVDINEQNKKLTLKF